MGQPVKDQSSGEPFAGYSHPAVAGPPSSKEGGGFSHLAAALDQLDLFRPRYLQQPLPLGEG